MENKSSLLLAGSAIITTSFALTSALIGLSVLSIFFISIAIIFNGILCVTLYKNSSQVLTKTPKFQEKQTRKQTSDDTTSLSGNFDEQANKESATKLGDEIEVAHEDEESGLLSGSFFPVYLDQRITSARRTLKPVSLVIFELDGLDKNDSGKTSDSNFFISAVGDVVKRTLRESDCAFRINENTFSAVMDDTAESGAVWAAERVRGVLHTGALAGRVTVSAGVACYPSHALEPQDLIDCANNALKRAKARGVDQVEIAIEQ